MKMIRGKLIQAKGVLKKLMRVSLSGHAGEVIDNRIMYQQAGHQSIPKAGTHVMAIREGDTVIVIGSADVDHVVKAPGDSAITSGLSEYVLVKGTGGIEIKSEQEVEVDAPSFKYKGQDLLALVDERILKAYDGHFHILDIPKGVSGPPMELKAGAPVPSVTASYKTAPIVEVPNGQ